MHTDTTLAELAIHHPTATKVFHRHGLDFCCKGGRSLAEACRSKSLDPEAVLAEIAAEDAPAEHTDWSERPLDELIDHILTRYHEPLREEVERLLEMARKVERVHGDKPSAPHGLAAHLATMRRDIEGHLEKEERILFPMIRAGQSATMPVRVMVMDHEDHAAALRRTRELTADFTPPREACTTWRALFLGLQTLEHDLMEHIHLENHVLFPRSLAGTHPLPLR
ncbi:MAG: iron-sulfur cluster repair protein YtfE [Planctomycetota bacterium]